VPESRSPVPPHLRRLVDDAAVFPPARTPIDRAVRAHVEHREAWYADLVGPLVVGDGMLPELLALVSTGSAPLDVTVVVTGGAGALEPAAAWATRDGRLVLRGLEVAVRESDAGDVAPNARRIVAAVDSLVASGTLDEEVPVFVEPPRLYGAEPTVSWLAVLDEVAAMDHRLKLRTGGMEADAFPSSEELAASIGAALDRELRFKCTAGLHHALRHRDATTGFEHHGFLNVLTATRASLDGASLADVAAVLEETDAETLGRHADDAGLASARRWFTSVGSCSVLDPVDDLCGLGLLHRP
jgi:hypothetical protein